MIEKKNLFRIEMILSEIALELFEIINMDK